jgi:hypothetical protein
MVSSVNHSANAFMFLTKKLEGFTPNATYSLTFTVELASSYAKESVGIGGGPGTGVYLKAGVLHTRPVISLVNGYYSLNLDKGNQASTGKEAVQLGNVGVEGTKPGYQLITRTHAQPLLARSSANGELWLVVGSDSGFEGLTTLYYS